MFHDFSHQIAFFKWVYPMFKNAKRCEPYKARVDEDYLIPTTLDIMKALFLMSCQISWMLNLVANLPHHGCVLQFHGNWRPSCQNCGWICLDQKQNWSFRHFEGHETSGSPPKKNLRWSRRFARLLCRAKRRWSRTKLHRSNPNLGIGMADIITVDVHPRTGWYIVKKKCTYGIYTYN